MLYLKVLVTIFWKCWRPRKCPSPIRCRFFWAFYNSGKVKTQVDEDDIYRGYMEFYYTANNWKDLEKDKSTSDFRTWDKKRCTSEALKNPVRFLLQSGKGFFVRKEGYVLALNQQLYEAVEMDGFAEQMKDVIDYRMMDYYRKRYEGKTE